MHLYDKTGVLSPKMRQSSLGGHRTGSADRVAVGSNIGFGQSDPLRPSLGRTSGSKSGSKSGCTATGACSWIDPGRFLRAINNTNAILLIGCRIYERREGEEAEVRTTVSIPGLALHDAMWDVPVTSVNHFASVGSVQLCTEGTKLWPPIFW